MKILHNFFNMLIRTSISLKEKYLPILKNLTKEKNKRSLSALINEIIDDYLLEREKKQRSRTMQKNYKKYMEIRSAKKFQENENMALEDLYNNYSS